MKTKRKAILTVLLDPSKASLPQYAAFKVALKAAITMPRLDDATLDRLFESLPK